MTTKKLFLNDLGGAFSLFFFSSFPPSRLILWGFKPSAGYVCADSNLVVVVRFNGGRGCERTAAMAMVYDAKKGRGIY